MTDAQDGGRLLLRRPRWTYRLRLAMTYALLLTVAGALMMTVVYVVVVLVPTYSFEPIAPTLPGMPVVESLPDGAVRADTESAGIVVSSREDLQRLILVVAGALLLALALVGTAAGWKIAGRMLRPLHDVSLAARQAATGRLDHRLGMGEPRDEVTDLAATFDRMLDGLEASFHAHQRFAANASHELRTPLATTKAMLDVALPAATGTQRELLQGLRVMNERSIETVSALLQLSDIDAPAVDPVERIDLAMLARSVIAEARDEADEAGVAIVEQLDEAHILGDRRLAWLLIDNLVKNAIRHNEPGGWAEVRTANTSGRMKVVVSNTGRSLTSDELAAMREPFQRAEGRSATHGHGLGLTIVATVADRFDATLHLAPFTGGGLVATVEFED